jgi:ribonucleoside-diphosphate reductase alpha chain
VDGIWKTGEPGILFYDEINRHNPVPDLGVIDSTNPCGEQPLLPYESCVLGSINLADCIHNGILDEDALTGTVRIGVRFLDKVIDKNVYPIPEIADATKKTRKIGLGLMGVHDALLTVGLAYDSSEGRAWCEHVMRTVTDTAVDESRRLAKKYGAFPAWEESIWKDFPMRNATLTTIAPTGTLSLLAGCSSGIEPVFSFAYTRRNTVGKTFVIVNPVFRAGLEKTLSDSGLSYAEQRKKVDEAINHVHERGTVQDLKWLPEKFRALFKTALDIHWKDHILMQAAFQKHVHASISKTINMPNTATREECADALLMAWKLKLKGITIYRIGSRQNVVLSLKDAALD